MNKIKSILDKHKGIRNEPAKETPYFQLPDGHLLGNGDVGVVVAGKPEKQVFRIAKSDFWTDSPLPYGNGWSNSLYAMYSPMPSGGLTIKIPYLEGADFHQEMDMYKAESKGLYKKNETVIKTISRVSAEDNYLVITLENENQNSEPVEVEVCVWTKPSRKGDINIPTSSGIEDNIFWVTRDTITHDEVRWIKKSVIATRILGVTYNTAKDGKLESTSSFTINPGQSVTIVSYVYTTDTFGEDVKWTNLTYNELDNICELLEYDQPELVREPAPSPLPYAKNRLKDVDMAFINKLNSEHEEWWKSFWEKGYIELPDELLLEKYWYSGLYIMASSEREGKIAGGLYGNWTTTDHLGWAGDYTWNYNHQHGRYPMYVCNRFELTKPYFDSVLANIPLSRKTAKDMGYIGVGVHYDNGYGPYNRTSYDKGELDGIYFNVHGGPFGLRWNIGYSLGMHANALEAAMNFIQYYQYTKDKEFLTDIAYPYMKEVANFWDSFLQKFDGFSEWTATETGSWTRWGPVIKEVKEINSVLEVKPAQNWVSNNTNMVIKSDNNLNINAANAKTVKIRIKTSRPLTDLVHFEFTKENSFNLMDHGSISFQLNASSEYDEYSLDMSSSSYWDNYIQKLRIRLPNSVQCYIDYIRILDKNGVIVKAWEFEGINIDKADIVKIGLKNNSKNTRARFSYITENDAKRNKMRSKTFDIKTIDSDFNEYIIDMSDVNEWSGKLCCQPKIRIEKDKENEGYFNIKYIKLLDSSEELIKKWSYRKEFNHAVNYRYMAYSNIHEGEFSEACDYVNPANVISMLKSLFKFLLNANKQLKVDKDKKVKWQDINEHLSDLNITKINGKPVITMDEVNNRPQDFMPVHLYGVFPAEYIGIDSKYAEAARNTIDILNCWKQNNSWAMLYPVAARIDYSFSIIRDHMLRELEEKTQFGSSNIFRKKDHASIENADAIEVVNSMLIQSNEGIIRLFPVWDWKKDASFKNLRAKGAFLVSGELKNGSITYAKIYSEKGNSVTIQNPCTEKNMIVKDADENNVSVFKDGDKYTFNTSTGEDYRITFSN